MEVKNYPNSKRATAQIIGKIAIARLYVADNDLRIQSMNINELKTLLQKVVFSSGGENIQSAYLGEYGETVIERKIKKWLRQKQFRRNC
ncbi:MAG: hypothetical protein COA57_02390 [Flavobacteriales bacterium]|nr:hypothetical protein [Bacteroidales bacterium AH-315-I05]PCJ89363.1 MAG: hypothetical protein COA57_02390 [Flavobacteriales bacterium]